MDHHHVMRPYNPEVADPQPPHRLWSMRHLLSVYAACACLAAKAEVSAEVLTCLEWLGQWLDRMGFAEKPTEDAAAFAEGLVRSLAGLCDGGASACNLIAEEVAPPPPGSPDGCFGGVVDEHCAKGIQGAMWRQLDRWPHRP